MNVNARLIEQSKPIVGLPPLAPSTSEPRYVHLKHYQKLTIFILALNGDESVAGSDITLLQATDFDGTEEKPVAISTVWANEDAAAGDVLVETAVVSDTFTTAETDADDKQLLYVLEIQATDLDYLNGFEYVRLGTADTTDVVVAVLYLLWPARYGGATPPTAVAPPAPPE